jgi:hypothetical protein
VLAANWAALAAVGFVAALGLLALIIVGTRRVRGEPPLDEEAETRLLLGETPEEVDAEMAAEAREAQGASITGFPPVEDDLDERALGDWDDRRVDERG